MKPELPFSRGLLIFAGLFFIVFVVMAANGADSSDHTPVVFEAESGTAGSGISIGQEGNIGYITAKTNFTGQSSPGDSTRLITCEIIFRDTGYYQLFVRMRVGAGAYDDDSFFAARGFGKKGLL